MKFFSKNVMMLGLLLPFVVHAAEVEGPIFTEVTDLSKSVFGQAGLEVLKQINEIKRAFEAQKDRPLISFIAEQNNRSLWGTFIKEAFLDLTVNDLTWIVEKTSKEDRDILFQHFFAAGNHGKRNAHARTVLALTDFTVKEGGFMGYRQTEAKFNFLSYCITKGHNDLFQKIVDFAPSILVSPDQVNDPASGMTFIPWLTKGVKEGNANIIEAATILTKKAVLDDKHAEFVASDFFLLAADLRGLGRIDDKDLLILRER